MAAGRSRTADSYVQKVVFVIILVAKCWLFSTAVVGSVIKGECPRENVMLLEVIVVTNAITPGQGPVKRKDASVGGSF
jgi:hypothetical protein